jgi:tyrosine-protein phosphatase SIW14
LNGIPFDALESISFVAGKVSRVSLQGRLVRTQAAVLLIACALAAPAWARPASDLSNIRIENFGRVSANYYRGAQPRGHDYADLAALGVKTIIDLTKDGDPGEAAQARAAGMRFVRIPMTTHERPSPAEVAQFLAIVNDPASEPVYVHCQGGRHRTGIMTAIYRMTDEGWNADRAFAEMKQYKFGADFLHPEFKEFVYGYHPAPAAAAAPVLASRTGG